jgi:Ca-activated chloride channel family protein
MVRCLHQICGVGVRGNRVAVCCLVAGLLSGVAGAGDGDSGVATPGAGRKIDDATLEKLRRLHYSESAQVRLVLLPASVTDRRGRIVRGLQRADFRVYDQGALQRIRYFSTGAQEPVSVAFLLDVSGSMRQMDKMEHAKEAVRHLVGRMGPKDRYGLICFADEQVVWVTEFTRDRGWFLKRLNVQEGYGQTALNDAVAAAPGLVDDTLRGRKAIVLITDGVDNFSRMTPGEAVGLARRVNVPIYTIGFLSVPAKMLPKNSLARRLETLGSFSEETGGAIFPVYDPAELKEAVAELDAELRFQYLIGYYPKVPGVKQDGDTFHRVRLEVAQRRATVRTRSGYFSAP